jgi:nucleoside-diphosphate-sugar epimerase
VTKLKGLGFSPKVPLEEGVARLTRWYVENEARRPAK